jgi:hypothetical protein
MAYGLAVLMGVWEALIVVVECVTLMHEQPLEYRALPWQPDA